MKRVARPKGIEDGPGRDRKIYVGCLNVVLHPHSKALYVKFLTALKNHRLAVKVRGDDALMIGSCIKSEDGSHYYGEIYKYLNLDANADWFNVESMSAASKKDVGTVVIPENLKPHFKKYPYVFFPYKHRLFFVAKTGGDTLAPSLLKKFLEGAAESELMAEFGRLTVTVEPKKGSTDELFKLPRLSKIELEIYKPNPDDHAGLDLEIQERLNNIHAKKEVVIYVEDDSEGLKPDDRLKALASVAASNGKVAVKGRNAQNDVVSLSTENSPLYEPVSFNPNNQTEDSALLQAALHIRRGL
ncbi:DUF4747 family protein [Pseudomonas fulva]|uniref:DUF4747 family protein n=1 Tax=Pseudomonas fulva TaxID=47880 RepID=UPI000D953EA2|nr:DUF4747 family protein [Pseudomonas fulva]PYB87187.1 hypothetical protein DMX01_17940 [Pseudomonas fulva]PYC10988.1 hypothetical protein DMX00_18710 [Pseudomonas fulva]